LQNAKEANTKYIEHIKPPCPCCYSYHKPSSVAAAWLNQCRLMVVFITIILFIIDIEIRIKAIQFVIMKPLLAVIPIISKWCGFDFQDISPFEGNYNINFHSPKLYIIIGIFL
jgi:hypothetical protein